MKKISFLTVLMLFAAQLTFAQASQVMAAYTYLDEYNRGKDGSDLLEAKASIDKAKENEKTGIQGKTWYYSGLIYYALANDSILSLADASYMTSAVNSFEKSLNLNDPKFRNSDDALTYLRAISSDVFNAGVDAYQKGDFETAYYKFAAMKDLNKTLKANNLDPVVETEKTVSSAAAAAESAGLNEEAVAAYKDLLTYNNEANNYRYLASLYNKMGERDKAMATLDQAAAAHPDNATIIIDQLNYYIEDGKLTEAIDKIDKAIELQPENDMLYFVKGNAYDKNGDTEKAIIEYERAIEVNPENTQALYNAGAMYFLGANTYIEQMSELGYKETKKYDELDAKRVELYLKAKPYFEKVLELIPDDDYATKALFKINRALEK